MIALNATKANALAGIRPGAAAPVALGEAAPLDVPLLVAEGLAVLPDALVDDFPSALSQIS